jgi:4-amino-4-deoxy-L-arabinose transferase-like glycosyltransferase
LSQRGTNLRPLPWLVATAVFVAVGFLYQIDGYALLDPDEGRNAEVAREMATSNDYVLPRLNGLPYADKPALFFAVAALVMEATGPTVLAARLTPLGFTIVTLAVVGWFAGILFGAGSRSVAVLATATTPFVLAYSRTVIFDSAVMLWVTLALLGAYCAVESRARRSTNDGTTAGAAPAGSVAVWWAALAWAAMGLGVLTKGPVALALPLMVAVPYALWRRAARALFDPLAVLVFVTVVLPWVAAVSQEVPGFLQYALVTETARRLATAELERTGPIWYFLVILPAAALPWSAVLAGGLWSRRRSLTRPVDHRAVFLTLWIVLPLLFFTLSQSKRPQYILPLIPAVGLGVAGLWRTGAGALPGVRTTATALGVIGAILVAARGRIASWIPAAQGGVAAAIPMTAGLLGALCITVAAGAWLTKARQWPTLLLLTLPVSGIPLVSLHLMQAIGEDRSAQSLAVAIGDAIGESGTVVGVAAYPPSLPFYLRRTIIVSTSDGAELTSNYVTRNIARMRTMPGSPLRDRTWWRAAAAACHEPTVFVTGVGETRVAAALASELPLLAVTRKYAAYGPCGSGLLAERSPEAAIRHVPRPDT